MGDGEVGGIVGVLERWLERETWKVEPSKRVLVYATGLPTRDLLKVSTYLLDFMNKPPKVCAMTLRARHEGFLNIGDEFSVDC